MARRTGVSPAVAQTLVNLRADLGGVRTMSNLKQALAARMAEIQA